MQALSQALDRANSDVVLIVDDIPDNLAVLHDALLCSALRRRYPTSCCSMP